MESQRKNVSPTHVKIIAGISHVIVFQKRNAD